MRSVTPFFWNHQFELIFHNVFPKTNRFSSLVTKPLRKFFLEGIFYPFSHTVHIFVKIIFFFKFMLIQSTQWNNLRFSPKAFTHIFNNYNFRLQGLQIEAFQQRYLKCKCETPYLEGELVPKTWRRKKNVLKKKFLSGLVTKLENLFVFGKTIWKMV